MHFSGLYTRLKEVKLAEFLVFGLSVSGFLISDYMLFTSRFEQLSFIIPALLFFFLGFRANYFSRLTFNKGLIALLVVGNLVCIILLSRNLKPTSGSMHGFLKEAKAQPLVRSLFEAHLVPTKAFLESKEDFIGLEPEEKTQVFVGMAERSQVSSNHSNPKLDWLPEIKMFPFFASSNDQPDSVFAGMEEESAIGSIQLSNRLLSENEDLME
ncbi:MAG: hypothetical protein L6Q78_10730 [Bacteroidia bacterium]|nr:hypothetical protein [Bacteroidia bacterium]